MRVDHSSRQITLATFLLCLVGAFASGGVDYFCRTTSIGARARTVRTCRLDDHDHQDHALEAPNLLSDCLANLGGDGGGQPSSAALRSGFPSLALTTGGIVAPLTFSSPSCTPVIGHSGRAPPSFS